MVYVFQAIRNIKERSAWFMCVWQVEMSRRVVISFIAKPILFFVKKMSALTIRNYFRKFIHFLFFERYIMIWPMY